MNTKSYETPVMTEFELLSEQTFLQSSIGSASTESYSTQSTYGTDGAGIWK